MMLIRHKTWDAIRDSFSEAEKSALRAAARGEAICPPGVVVDEGRLPPALSDKLRAAMAGAT